MDQTMKLLLLGMFYSSLFSYYKIIGVDGGRKMSKEEIEIENELKLLNKPYIKTIKTKYGEIYDCVDFYKQPAFDHPLLKNHTFYPEMKPSSIPSIRGGKKLLKEYSKSSFSRARCPLGTVPIRRTTKEDIIRTKLHSEKYGSDINREHPGYHYSIATTKPDSTKRYLGASTKISVWNPPVMSSQYSTSRLKIQNGRNSVEFGWTVNPILYGDNKTHVYTQAKFDQSKCVNAHCSGFVVVDRDTTIGAIIEPVSQKGRDVMSMSFMIAKDTFADTDGNWWLQIGDDRRSIGFWPKNVLTDLSFASSIEWGGEVFSPPNLPSPPMGSGEPTISGKMKNEAFCRSMTVVNDGGPGYEDTTDLQLYNDDPDHYDIKDYSYRLPFLYAIVLFGGSGGATY